MQSISKNNMFDNTETTTANVSGLASLATLLPQAPASLVPNVLSQSAQNSLFSSPNVSTAIPSSPSTPISAVPSTSSTPISAVPSAASTPISAVPSTIPTEKDKKDKSSITEIGAKQKKKTQKKSERKSNKTKSDAAKSITKSKQSKSDGSVTKQKKSKRKSDGSVTKQSKSRAKKEKPVKETIKLLSDEDKSKISISELKAKCRELGVRGYSKKTKEELMDLLLKSFNNDQEVQKISLLVKNVQHLKKICRELGVRGYSKKKKNELVDIICEEREHKQKIETEIDNCLENKPIPDYLLTKTIMMNCYKYIESKKLNISLKEAVKCISDDYTQIKRDIIKLLCKKIKKLGGSTDGPQKVQNGEEADKVVQNEQKTDKVVEVSS